MLLDDFADQVMTGGSEFNVKHAPVFVVWFAPDQPGCLQLVQPAGHSSGC